MPWTESLNTTKASGKPGADADKGKGRTQIPGESEGHNRAPKPVTISEATQSPPESASMTKHATQQPPKTATKQATQQPSPGQTKQATQLPSQRQTKQATQQPSRSQTKRMGDVTQPSGGQTQGTTQVPIDPSTGFPTTESMQAGPSGTIRQYGNTTGQDSGTTGRYAGGTSSYTTQRAGTQASRGGTSATRNARRSSPSSTATQVAKAGTNAARTSRQSSPPKEGQQTSELTATRGALVPYHPPGTKSATQQSSARGPSTTQRTSDSQATRYYGNQSTSRPGGSQMGVMRAGHYQQTMPLGSQQQSSLGTISEVTETAQTNQYQPAMPPGSTQHGTVQQGAVVPSPGTRRAPQTSQYQHTMPLGGMQQGAMVPASDSQAQRARQSTGLTTVVRDLASQYQNLQLDVQAQNAEQSHQQLIPAQQAGEVVRRAQGDSRVEASFAKLKEEAQQEQARRDEHWIMRKEWQERSKARDHNRKLELIQEQRDSRQEAHEQAMELQKARHEHESSAREEENRAEERRKQISHDEQMQTADRQERRQRQQAEHDRWKIEQRYKAERDERQDVIQLENQLQGHFKERELNVMEHGYQYNPRDRQGRGTGGGRGALRRHHY